MPEYGLESYWDARYQTDEVAYEWLTAYDDFKHLFESSLTSSDARNEQKILVAGCGNSQLAMDMFQSGYRNFVCADYSLEAIQLARKIWPDFVYDRVDLTATPYETESFDVVMDKCTLDCIVCGGKELEYVREMYRVLKPGGMLFAVSYSPHRLECLNTVPWKSIATDKLKNTNQAPMPAGKTCYTPEIFTFIYVMHK